MKIAITVTLSLSLFQAVLPHGFMMGITDCETKQSLQKARGYDKISFAIDDLRNPSIVLCRDEAPIQAVIVDPGEICVSLAISDNANHKGACELVFVSETSSTSLGKYSNCVSEGVEPEDTNIPQMVTNDMKRYVKSFTIPFNLEGERGVLRWLWVAEHVEPNEGYNNCIDVIVQKRLSSCA